MVSSLKQFGSAAMVALFLACSGSASEQDITPDSHTIDSQPSDAAVPPDGTVLPFVEGGDLSQRTCPPDSFLSYDNFGAPFFATYCVGCHSSELPEERRGDAPLDANFETLEKIRMHADKIYKRAADKYETMPSAGGPASHVRMQLGEWLACGAK